MVPDKFIIRVFILIFSGIFHSISGFSQITVTVGTGTITNSTTTYPAPYCNWYWGAKQQYLILASELNAAGMGVGTITEIAFDVMSAQGTPLNGLTFAMKNTSTSSLTTFETGTTVVFSPQSYTEFNGWNTHVLTTPFYWDGVSNLLIETCFNNASYTLNAQVYQTATSFTSSVVYYSDASANCSQVAPFQNYTQRPNMKITSVPSNLPPITNFSSNTTSSCSGTIYFYDQSSNFPTSWLWNFGDGNTSTQQNPVHTYGTNGTFSVTLITYNANGSDTLVLTNYITINSSVPVPVSASCTPVTQNGSFGFGITSFNLNTINNTSSDASAGYEDFTCLQTVLYAGQNYSIAYDHLVPSTHNSAVWIDFNNNGIFETPSETVFYSNNSLSPSGTIFIPSTATLNTPLRLRVWADYDFSAPPSPCGNPDYGQAEDYTVIIESNPFAPEAAFAVDDNHTCVGVVCFDDVSLNVPTSWLWNFGDGNTSVLQYPCHTYAADGVYDVTLITTNANGADTVTIVGAVDVNTASAVTASSCSPSTLGYCCGYGIYKVDFNTINNISNDGAEGYMDFSCDIQTIVIEGQFYNLEVRTGINNAQDTRAWIDFDNDGVFTPAELIMDAPNDYDPIVNIAIPSGAVLNTPLRMRISSDVIGTPQLGCTNNDFGQTEDYAVIITSNNAAPLADFSATPTSVCSGPVQFTDMSLNVPTSWLWDFGDGNTSTLQNPTHTYSNIGNYTVTLIATNSFGADTVVFQNYIMVNCDNVVMPVSGTQTITACSGTVFDDGGSTGFYSDNTDGVIVIEPSGATSILLSFVTFDFVASFAGDTLYVYDGNSTSAPLLGAFSGNGLPPNIVSSSGAITLRQKTDASVTDPGFMATWNCITGIEEEEKVTVNIFPNPASNQVNIASSVPVSFKMYNHLGQIVLFGENHSSLFTLDVTSLADGIYFIELSGEKINGMMRKVVIQK